MFCRNCGNKIPENAKFCPKCGAEVQGEQNASTNQKEEQNVKDTNVQSEKIDVKKEMKDFAVGTAGYYFDYKFKILFIGCILCALFFFTQHLIVPGIILLIWGIILSPTVVKKLFKNNRKAKVILFSLVILSAIIIAAIWVEPSEQNAESSETLNTQNDTIVLQVDETAQLNSTDESGNIVEDEELLLTVHSARAYMDDNEYGLGIGEITAIDYEFENTGNSDVYAGPEYLTVYADGQYVEQVYPINSDDFTNGGMISPGRILSGTIYVDFVINAYDDVEVECGNITWNMGR